MRRYTFALLALAAVALAMYVDRTVAPLSGEAIDPCETPLEWHVGTVDPRFELSPDAARQAVAEAAGLWERAAGRQFFSHAPDRGMAVELVYDHRQESYERLQPHEARVRDLASRADAQRARVEALQQRVEADRSEHERRGTESAAQRYQASVDRYNRAVDQYNLSASLYNDAVEEARSARAQGPQETRAGDLQWTTQTVNGRVVSVRRTLTVGLFGSYEELVLVLAHELGHALGIGHVPDPDAIMAEAFRQGDVTLPLRLRPADRDALARQCGLAS